MNCLTIQRANVFSLSLQKFCSRSDSLRAYQFRYALFLFILGTWKKISSSDPICILFFVKISPFGYLQKNDFPRPSIPRISWVFSENFSPYTQSVYIILDIPHNLGSENQLFAYIPKETLQEKLNRQNRESQNRFCNSLLFFVSITSDVSR